MLCGLLAFLLGRPCIVIALDHYKLLDLHVGDQRYVGRVMTHNDQLCWLLHRDGRLQQFPIAKVTEFTEVSDRFKPHTQLELKSQLRSEFDQTYEVRTTSHYVVVARQGAAEGYAKIFEEIYRDFVRAFRSRGFHVDEPEFPLVAIVFQDQAGFLKYCRNEGTQALPGMMGYYLSTSNRVAMFERPNASEVDKTVIHEATHQIAFNTGIHSRLAKHPRWVVEGLATVFEADGVRSRQGTTSPLDRVNRERYLWFGDYSRSRRATQSLSGFIRDDQAFGASILDAYAESWALSFYLIETRPAEYSRYLKQLVKRDPLSGYDGAARLKDFTDTFGEVHALESAYLRFYQHLTQR